LSLVRSLSFRPPQSGRRSASISSKKTPAIGSNIARVDAESGDEVELADIIKGYEVGKSEYIELDPEELEAVAIESKRVIEMDEFVPKNEIDELYLSSPYYIVPDGEVGQQALLP
jgi:non-homologous end joining protein Ku